MKSLIILQAAKSIDAGAAHLEPSLATLQQHVNLAGQDMFAQDRRTGPSQLIKIIIEVTSVPRDITALKVHSSPKSASQASSIRWRVCKPKRIASYVHPVHSRIFTARRDAKSAVSSPTLVKVKTSASALETIGLIQLRTPHADARVDSITSTMKKNRKVTSVT